MGDTMLVRGAAPSGIEAWRLRDGRTVAVRPVTAGDASALVAFHAACSAQSQYLRFHSSKPKLRVAEAEYLAAADGRERVAFVVTVPAGDGSAGGGAGAGAGEHVVADARFDVTGPAEAEAAFLVRDDYQGTGLGSALLAHLAAAATARGLRRLLMEVLVENRAMINLATRAGARPGRFDGRSIRFTLDLEQLPAPFLSPLGWCLVLPEDGDAAQQALSTV